MKSWTHPFEAFRAKDSFLCQVQGNENYHKTLIFRVLERHWSL